MNDSMTIGQYLAHRLEQIGVTEYFGVPGDYNLVLLDELISNKNIKMISCCNELNAGYAADGYARTKGVSAAVVTYSVGSLSMINAVAGAYSEDLPMIVISGGPNSRSTAEHRLLHHTIGLYDLQYVSDMFSHVTVATKIVKYPEQAASQIDNAISLALLQKKPVYIEIACNIADIKISRPNPRRFALTHTSDPESLKKAVEHVASVLNQATRPVFIAGCQLRSWGAIDAFQKCAKASGYAVATMPDAKSFFPENNKAYIGRYWGPVSSQGCGEIVESADKYLFAGAVFNDYSTSGYTSLISDDKFIQVSPTSVELDGQFYGNVQIAEFLTALSKKLKTNSESLTAFERVREQVTPYKYCPEKPITTRNLFTNIEAMLDDKHTIFAETGDSWFNGLDLKLPANTRFESQMRYGSIGWSTGAVLGAAIADKNRRVIGFIGDGSFQLTAQEISTMIRYDANPIIFLMNNRGYTIEVEIHDGPYNRIKNWHYKDLVEVFSAGEGKAWGCEVKTEKDLKAALEKAKKHTQGLCFIEVHLDPDDCNKNLLKWGSLVARANSKKP